ncbi:MAG TPA: hypothetical protein IAA27_00615 [Candidatus Enterococcus stercoravium]|nr:hypothetical protein [Candidatus Enterococcus stercoravium]
MTTTALTTPENLVVAYQLTGNNSIFSSIYDFVQSNSAQAYSILHDILPESMLDSGELSAIVDDSLLQSLKSYNNAESSAGFLAYFLEIVRRTAEGIKRVRGVKVATVSEIYFYKVANSLPESAVQLWQKQWRMTVDELCNFKAEVNAAVAIFNSYSDSNSLHKQWAKLLAWESTEFLGCSAYMPMNQQELQRARVSFRAYCQNKQRQDTAKQLRLLVTTYQKECSAQLFNAIYDPAAVVEVAQEYRNYMADPESYCVGQAVLHSDYIEMMLENALEAAVMELPEGAELPAVYGKYIMAEFEYFILQVERETESTTSQQV